MLGAIQSSTACFADFPHHSIAYGIYAPYGLYGGKLELVNTHCHSRFCGHGEGEIEDYATIASEKGLTTLAFTEHYPLSERFDPREYLSVKEEDMPKYINDVLAARERHPEIDILLGVEMDYLGDLEDRDIKQSDLDPFDLILASVHFVDGWAFDDPDDRDRWNEPGAPDEIWNRYVELWCEVASDKDYRAEVMSHPDLAKKFAYYPTFSLEPKYRMMAEAAAAGGRMIELNTSGQYYACKEVFPAMPLLSEFAKAGVPCTIGADAHKPELVARDVDKAYKTLYDAGYRKITVPTKNRGRREIAL